MAHLKLMAKSVIWKELTSRAVLSWTYGPIAPIFYSTCAPVYLLSIVQYLALADVYKKMLFKMRREVY